MRKRAAQNLAVKHAGHGEIADKLRLARDFLQAIDARDAVTDVFKLSLCHELSESKDRSNFLTKRSIQIKEVISKFNLSFRALRLRSG
jgi:RNAse (barnase) inhibitor barstar